MEQGCYAVGNFTYNVTNGLPYTTRLFTYTREILSSNLFSFSHKKFEGN